MLLAVRWLWICVSWIEPLAGTMNVPAQEVLGKLKDFAGTWQGKPIVRRRCW